MFTDRPLTGNGLAVVHDADGLDDEVMLAFARETRLSETTFVQSSRAGEADYRNRIFMPLGEIPFAGHPSLGTAVAVALERGESRTTLRQETVPGVQPVEVELDGRRARASMLQEPASFGEELDAEHVLGLVGLTAADADPRLPPQAISTGVVQPIVCVAERAALDRCVPDYERIGELIASLGAVVLYIAWVDGERAVARSFTAAGDVGEDPATGSAAAPLLAHANARLGTMRLSIEQGAAIGRPSQLRCSVEGDRVRVGGDVVVLFDGTVHLDA